MARKLASIQKILDIQPIPDADRIELATVLGWKVVVRKGEFAVGELVVYFEIDSVLPFEEWSEFLRNKDKPEKPIRLKTKKMRGQVSQGLCMPLSILDNDIKKYDDLEGEDVTEALGVVKYEPPVSARMSGQVRGAFPGHLPKTDEERIQSSPALLDELRGLHCMSTVKCDGTSVTFAKVSEDEPIHVCSRNLSLEDGDNVYWDMFRKYNIEEILNSLDGLYAIQGEIVGPGIQKNRMGLDEVQLMVFDVRNVKAGRYLEPENLMAFCDIHNLIMVPIDCDFVFDHTVEELLEMAKGKYPTNNHEREGIVIRPLNNTYSPTLSGRLSVKVINNEYLVKIGE